jgi:hypothetical protein
VNTAGLPGSAAKIAPQRGTYSFAALHPLATRDGNRGNLRRFGAQTSPFRWERTS